MEIQRFHNIVDSTNTLRAQKERSLQEALGKPGTPDWEDNVTAYLAFKTELDDTAVTILQLGPSVANHEASVNALKEEVKNYAAGTTKELKDKFTKIADTMISDAGRIEKGSVRARHYSGVYDLLREIESKVDDPRFNAEKESSQAYWSSLLDAANQYASRKTSLVQFPPIYAASLKPDFDARIAYEARIAADKVQKAYNKTVQGFKKGAGHSIVAPRKATFAKKHRQP